MPISLPRLSLRLDEIRAALFNHIDAAQDKLAAQGFLPSRLNLNQGVVRGLLEMYAWGQWQLYALLARLLAQAAPYHATGKWLDLHADGVGLARRAATKAAGRVRFYRAAQGQEGNVSIPAGRIVRTLPDGAGQVYRYSNPAPAVLPAGADFVDVPVEAESYGASSNASAGQICELVTPVAGIERVSNAAGWLTSEGANEETDAQLAQRYRLQWQGNNGCTKHAYMAWALAVAGVTSVSILDQHPRGQGTVDVVVRGADVLPTESLLAKVREAIAPHTPINDDWLVKAPQAVPLKLTGELEYIAADPAVVKAQAENRLRALFAETSPLQGITALQIGQDVTLDLLTHTVMAVAGVKRVRWASPAADAVIAADAVARLDALTLTVVQAGEA
ncbi:MAG: baseplate J/gp47 family protein [Desulfovibrionaceae bacterium]|nr:baseplate J/gp47 family protein [Desulfovibrionaceae bacterium]